MYHKKGLLVVKAKNGAFFPYHEGKPVSSVRAEKRQSSILPLTWEVVDQQAQAQTNDTQVLTYLYALYPLLCEA